MKDGNKLICNLTSFSFSSSSFSSVLKRSAAPNLMIVCSSSLSNDSSAFFLAFFPAMTVLPVVSMFWMTRWSRTILFFAFWMMSSSTLELATSLKIFTSSF